MKRSVRSHYTTKIINQKLHEWFRKKCQFNSRLTYFFHSLAARYRFHFYRLMALLMFDMKINCDIGILLNHTFRMDNGHFLPNQPLLKSIKHCHNFHMMAIFARWFLLDKITMEKKLKIDGTPIPKWKLIVYTFDIVRIYCFQIKRKIFFWCVKTRHHWHNEYKELRNIRSY